ncbi:acetyl-CoA synthetase, partial [Nonomuraea wenchangensis]
PGRARTPAEEAGPVPPGGGVANGAGCAAQDLPGGGRAHAVVEEPALLAEAESRELVGQRVRLVSPDGKVNVASW